MDYKIKMINVTEETTKGINVGDVFFCARNKRFYIIISIDFRNHGWIKLQGIFKNGGLQRNFKSYYNMVEFHKELVPAEYPEDIRLEVLKRLLK